MFEQIAFSEKRALFFVRYYENLATDPKNPQGLEFWMPCLDVANEWLRLVRQPHPNLQEVDTLIAVLKSKNQGSAWVDLYMHVNTWSQGLSRKP